MDSFEQKTLNPKTNLPYLLPDEESNICYRHFIYNLLHNLLLNGERCYCSVAFWFLRLLFYYHFCRRSSNRTLLSDFVMNGVRFSFKITSHTRGAPWHREIDVLCRSLQPFIRCLRTFWEKKQQQQQQADTRYASCWIYWAIKCHPFFRRSFILLPLCRELSLPLDQTKNGMYVVQRRIFVLPPRVGSVIVKG